MLKVRQMLRFSGLVIVAFLPGTWKRLVYRHVFKYEVHDTARIRICFIDADRVTLGANSAIGHFTVIRHLPELHLGDHATIGQWNWITCGEFFTSGESEVPPPAQQGLFIDRHAALTSRHYVDCAGGVFIGAFTTVAGVRSTIMTHQINMEGRQVCAPVRIGDFCYIGSDVKFVPGATVPDRSVVGMGAVVAGELPDCEGLYVGVPARFVRTIEQSEYFTRTVGRAR